MFLFPVLSKRCLNVWFFEQMTELFEILYVSLRVKIERRKSFDEINDFNRKANRNQNIYFFDVAYLNWKTINLFNSKIEISFNVANNTKSLKFKSNFFISIFISFSSTIEFSNSFDVVIVETNDISIVVKSTSLITLICLIFEILFDVENLTSSFICCRKFLTNEQFDD